MNTCCVVEGNPQGPVVVEPDFANPTLSRTKFATVPAGRADQGAILQLLHQLADLRVGIDVHAGLFRADHRVFSQGSDHCVPGQAGAFDPRWKLTDSFK